jgi:hypothetical protein
VLRSISFEKLGLLFKVKGSARFIWKTKGRHETWGQTSTPRARDSSFLSTTFSWYG